MRKASVLDAGGNVTEEFYYDNLHWNGDVGIFTRGSIGIIRAIPKAHLKLHEMKEQ